MIKEILKFAGLILILAILITIVANDFKKNVTVESVTDFILDIKDEVEQTIDEREND